jgi:Fe-S cluster assembly protein SufD
MKNIVNVTTGQKKVIPILWTGQEPQISFTILLSGKGAEIEMPIMLLGRESQTVFIEIEIYHQKPNTRSLLTVNGAMYDRSKVDFNGLVKIEKGAKGANAWLGAKLLLLSKQASGKAVPNLEIEENEVKAGHAATVGKVNELELFYLMSRGFSQETATDMIVNGFLKNMLEQFPKDLSDKALSILKI